MEVSCVFGSDFPFLWLITFCNCFIFHGLKTVKILSSSIDLLWWIKVIWFVGCKIVFQIDEQFLNFFLKFQDWIIISNTNCMEKNKREPYIFRAMFNPALNSSFRELFYFVTHTTHFWQKRSWALSQLITYIDWGISTGGIFQVNMVTLRWSLTFVTFDPSLMANKVGLGDNHGFLKKIENTPESDF